jgi:glycosyltransferase involved in cell wall biosynthesis
MSNTVNSEKVPRVSVLMSVYNGERFLINSVESILEQTFPDFEFLIIDDGSTDSTWEILEKYADKEARIILVRNEKNIGLTRSLNKGLALARGEYLARQDADDISLPQRLEMQVKFLDAHPEVSLVGTGMEIIDENGKILALHQPPTDHESIAAELLIKNNSVGHSTVMARLDILKELRGYNERLPYAQDYDLWWRLCRKRKIANLPEILVKWRDTPGNISRAHRADQLEYIFATSIAAIRESLKDKTLDEEAYRRFWWAYHGYLDKLQKGDIQCLEPLWDLLASKKAKLTATSKGLQNMLYHLVRERKFKEASQLMKVLKHRLNQPVNWIPVLKSLARSFI